MTTTFEKSFDIDAPIEEVFEQWAQFANYPRFMPHVREVQSMEGNRWIWETGDQQWQVEMTAQTPQKSISWRITAPDYTSDATMRFEPLEDGQGTKLVYTTHYPNGFGAQHTAASVVEDMQNALMRFAKQAVGQATEEIAEQTAEQAQVMEKVFSPLNLVSGAASRAAQELEDDIPFIVESTKTLQRTLAEATQAWTSSFAKAFESFNALIWSPVESLAHELDPSVQTWSPRFEMTEGDGMLLVRSELPGYEATDLHVEIVDGELLISGERQVSQSAGEAGSEEDIHVLERFQQRLTLTQAVEASQVEAQVTPAGQLRIALPLKQEEAAYAGA
jgi:HSP20 family molecular chaperone IbpA/uncharacterized protein YndB with AHSA1/START domain